MTSRRLLSRFARHAGRAVAAALLLVAVAPLFVPGAGSAAAGGGAEGAPEAVSKLTFDRSMIDDEGLAGPPDGKVAVAYEFCIPAAADRAAEVQGIDPTASIQRGSPGRIGCGPGQWLVLGSTHQPGWRVVLERLAALDYVARIDRADFE